jgi:hypothetical protein
MRTTKRKPFLFVALLGALFCLISSVQGQPYEVDWYTVDGGGGTSSGGDFVLSGTIGQPDAGTMAGEDYILVGGFWAGQKFCFVNLPDLSNFLNEWLLKESEVGHPLDADFNQDGEVNLKDYNILCSYWMQYCPDTWPSW